MLGVKYACRIAYVSSLEALHEMLGLRSGFRMRSYKVRKTHSCRLFERKVTEKAKPKHVLALIAKCRSRAGTLPAAWPVGLGVRRGVEENG